jgi:hypothetical protein
MKREEMILVGLAPANGSIHSPVQVQKLFFLIDQNIAKTVGGPHFNFQPYNYGPFDKRVYETLEVMASEGLIEIVPIYTWKSYKLTETGQVLGEKLLNGLSEPIRNYVGELSRFVRSLTFSQLVSAIYKAYPDMRANSVFQN